MWFYQNIHIVHFSGINLIWCIECPWYDAIYNRFILFLSLFLLWINIQGIGSLFIHYSKKWFYSKRILKNLWAILWLLKYWYPYAAIFNVIWNDDAMIRINYQKLYECLLAHKHIHTWRFICFIQFYTRILRFRFDVCSNFEINSLKF